MKILLLILVLGLSVSGQGIVSKWYQLNAEADGFSANFPVEPKIETEKNSTVTQHTYSVQLRDSSVFTVIHSAMPRGLGSSEDILKLLEEMERSYLSSLKGEIGQSTTVQNKGCSGKQVTITKAQSVIYFRFFVSGQSIYIIGYGTDNQSKQTPIIRDYFFNSFEVKGGCTNLISPSEAPSSEVKTEKLVGIYDPNSKWNKITLIADGLEYLTPYSVVRNEQEMSVVPRKLFQWTTQNRVRNEQEMSVVPYRLTRRTYTSSSQTETYYVFVLGDLPEESVQPQFYSTALKKLVENFKSELESVDPNTQLTLIRNLTVGNYPGREYKVLFKDRVGKIQCFVTTKRSYIFTYSEVLNKYSTENANKFFNGIKISVK